MFGVEIRQYKAQSCQIQYRPKSTMESVTVQYQSTVQTNIPFIACSSITIVALIALLLIYRMRFVQAPPIVAILALLLFNDIAQLAFQLPNYLQNIANGICIFSIMGTTFFRLASYYWLIFVIRLLYRWKVTPGKFLDLSKYIGKYIVFTYIPSISVVLVIFIAVNIDDTSSESNCWRHIKQKTATDYIIYLSSFVLPNLIAFLIILYFLISYLKNTAYASHTLLLSFPLLGVLFIGYEMTLRMMIFFEEWAISNELELPFLLQPFFHGVLFTLVLVNVYRGKKLTASEMTISSPDNKQDSFMIPSEPI